MRKCFHEEGSLALLQIILGNWMRKSSDLSNKVVTFLNLATDICPENIVPEYCKTTNQIGKELVKGFIMR